MQKNFLPRVECGENLFVTIHPGYSGVSKLYYPYERSKKSSAYIPWNCGENYVIGAMYSGISDAFLRMSKTLERNIEEDLKKNFIAKFHDESHLNRYIIRKSWLRIISSAYCYPFGNSIMLPNSQTYPKKIYAVSKQEKFDVKTFKGHCDDSSGAFRHKLRKLKNKLLLKERFCCLRDIVLRRNLQPVKDIE